MTKCRIQPHRSAGLHVQTRFRSVKSLECSFQHVSFVADRHDYCNSNVSDVMSNVPKMRQALDLHVAGRDMIYYVDADTTERVYMYDPSFQDPRYSLQYL